MKICIPPFAGRGEATIRFSERLVEMRRGEWGPSRQPAFAFHWRQGGQLIAMVPIFSTDAEYLVGDDLRFIDQYPVWGGQRSILEGYTHLTSPLVIWFKRPYTATRPIPVTHWENA